MAAADEAARPLGPLHVAAVVVGAIVGVGIFFTPASLARALPSPAWVLGLWALGGFVSICGALVHAGLGAQFPKAGGSYVFLRQGFGERAGPPVAFLYGWTQLLVVQPGSTAIIALVLVDHLALLGGALSPAARTGATLAIIAGVTAANLLGLRTGGRIQLAMAALKVAALLAVIAVGVGWGGAARILAPRAERPAGDPASWLLLGLLPVLFSFGGAYHATFLGGSVRDPERNLPRGIALGIALVVVGYTGINVAYLSLLGHDGLAASQSPAADAAALALGDRAGQALAAVIVLSAAGILNTIALGFPFVVYAMARDGLFFAKAGELSPRTGRPALAVGVQGLLSCAAVLVGASRVDHLLTGIAFADALFQAAVAFVAVRPPPGAARARAPAWAAWVVIILELGIALGCLVQKPAESAYGAALLGVGVGLYFVWTRGARGRR